jgi:succinate dehydrogenase hydrophobic anchor subunit
MMRVRAIPQRGLTLEYMMWLFTRLSGLALIGAALFGIGMAFFYGARNQVDMITVFRWTFFPNHYHIEAAKDAIVDFEKWTTDLWQIMQLLILFFGVTHGINGLRVVCEDYIGGPLKRLFWRGFIFLIWTFILIVAVYVAIKA